VIGRVSDAIVAVRRQLSAEAALSAPPPDTESAKVPRELFNRLADLACSPHGNRKTELRENIS
jgi:hypothetical protein